MKYKAMARLLITARRESGLSQRAVANQLKFSNQYISNAERGISSIAPIYFLPLARIYTGVSAMDFVNAYLKDERARVISEVKLGVAG